MMTSSQELLLSSITQYYDKHPDYKMTLYNIIQGDYKISLRVIDWFITHYSKIKNLIFWIDMTNGILIEKPSQFSANLKKFHLYLEYRAQLKSYTKMFFDPFRRHERISFVISKKPMQVMETTIGQLNFFRWIFQNHILEYISLYQEDIEEEMAKFQSIKKENITGSVTNTTTNATVAVPVKKKKNSRSVEKSVNKTFLQTPCYLRFD